MVQAAAYYVSEQRVLRREEPIGILAVEDDIVGMEFLEAQIRNLGHEMFRADNGKRALAVLESNPGKIDVVLMDREMPVMDGLAAVRRMKDSARLRNIPVVMVTGADSAADMKEGLDAGVFYYLMKPVAEETLRSVLSAAVREARQAKTLSEELAKHHDSFGMIDACRFRFRTLSEAESLAAFMANCFPDPARVLTGLGELLINAVEHGNLGVGYERKTELIAGGIWRAEIERLQKLPGNEKKYATATVVKKENGVYAVIEDQGAGFEWRKYMKIDPARASDNHGRGIAQANTVSFDRMTYDSSGAKVVAFVGSGKKLEW